MDPVFPRTEVVLVLHDAVVAVHGGLPGIRDENLLLSALARAENKHACGEPGTYDLFDLAAYAFGIAKNHPFNDGNKRSALGACLMFLELNEVTMPEQPEDAVERMVGLAEGSIDEAGFAAWLRGLA